MAKITPHTKIGELVKEYPAAARILKNFGMDCIGCGGIGNETILLGATAHGLDPEKIVDALNAAVE